ncbi:hypothetical protein GUITHDRAFT_162359 [Guillardia theta CCMP2712]|uniref:Uncharacterized protein n=1 Tax=Guillardia theta (strain CCMP2712) TaxID=905079 RepID=L1JKA2_GUITC|nr:hypothetical protein GUITHDRAFT_162359 [Guillardia theta CCMP2712]EKX48943.1 hypothetical protein GUITHDRAFT_162359 [Guillardia theta CCMP2712]|eukprot:XP_005835923.1 hypothetical protein GUITHDRAFT_162359 [Guillardia theta CCMP2712]
MSYPYASYAAPAGLPISGTPAPYPVMSQVPMGMPTFPEQTAYMPQQYVMPQQYDMQPMPQPQQMMPQQMMPMGQPQPQQAPARAAPAPAGKKNDDPELNAPPGFKFAGYAPVPKPGQKSELENTPGWEYVDGKWLFTGKTQPQPPIVQPAPAPMPMPVYQQPVQYVTTSAAPVSYVVPEQQVGYEQMYSAQPMMMSMAPPATYTQTPYYTGY